MATAHLNGATPPFQPQATASFNNVALNPTCFISIEIITVACPHCGSHRPVFRDTYQTKTTHKIPVPCDGCDQPINITTLPDLNATEQEMLEVIAELGPIKAVDIAKEIHRELRTAERYLRPSGPLRNHGIVNDPQYGYAIKTS